jgi:hypothetical protein
MLAKACNALAVARKSPFLAANAYLRLLDCESFLHQFNGLLLGENHLLPFFLFFFFTIENPYL